MDKSYIKSIISKILDKTFSSRNKRKIVEYEDRLNFSCPCCGDSKNEFKKRGNLYFNKLFYICFNCDKKSSFDRFCREFNESIDPDKKMEMINHLESVMVYSDYENDFMDANVNDLIDLSDLEDVFNNRNISPIFDFHPVRVGSGVYKYLVGRGISKKYQNNIYQAKFSKGDEGFDHIIVLLNRRGNKVLGLQIRNLKEGRRRFFLIYNWSTLYKWIHGEDVEVDSTKEVIYNKLSYYFNILNVDFSKTITVFEGYLDSLFYPNSVGVVGTNTDLRFIESNNLDIQYFFDNDSAGFKKSEKKIKDGFKIFLWKKLFDDIVLKKKSKDPHNLLNRISKVKDLNKLSEIVPESYKKLGLEDYFSQDEMDIKYLPKITWKPKNNDKDYRKEFSLKDI